MTDTPSNDTPPPNEPNTPPSARDTAINAAKQAKGVADTVGKVAEGAGTAFNAIKWVAIAVTFGFIFGFGLLAYKMVSAPAKAAANATESVTEAVKSSASSVAEGTSNVLTRLHIPSPNQTQTNKHAELAFTRLNTMTPRAPETLRARTFWAANLKGHENRVCQLSMNFGAGDIPILIAADNKAHVGAKSLGSKNDRLIRLMIRAEGNDMPLRIEWNEETQNWIMKWRSNTVKKPLEDSIAAERIADILRSTKTC